MDGSESAIELRLTEGCELLGRYESAAFEQPQYLVRRGDDQLVRVSRILYLLAGHLDGGRSAGEIAERMSADLGRKVSADNVQYLVRQKLQPSGLVATTGKAPVPPPSAKPLLALRFRARLVPERAHRRATIMLRPLFWPPAIAVVLAGLFSLDTWLLATRGAGVFGLTRQVIVHPWQFLLLTTLVLTACVFHEFGHATGARYGGARPGAMGVGLYLGLPVLYTDVTDTYRLDRGGRLRTDLGGVYFNAVAIVLAGMTYFATGFKPLLVFALVCQLQVLYQFLPTVRMDGYYVVSDLIGVPNLFAFVRPVAKNLPRFSAPAHGPLSQLKRGPLIAITVWVCLTVPILVANVGFFAVVAPRVLPTLWSAAWREEHVTAIALDHGAVAQALNGGISVLILVATGSGILLTGCLIVFRLGRLAARLVVPRIGHLAQRYEYVLYAVAVGLPLTSTAVLAVGCLQHVATLVLVSMVCSAVAGVTLASLALVDRPDRAAHSADGNAGGCQGCIIAAQSQD